MTHKKSDWKIEDSDGCTFWPDGDYRSCCVVHDEAYASGGGWRERLRADYELAKCVKRAGHPVIGPVMFLGVRVFGIGLLPWRHVWGKRETKFFTDHRR